MINATVQTPIMPAYSAFGCSDDLCDQLTEHMLDCDTCIAGEQDCQHYLEMRRRIQVLGGATTPAVFAY